MVAMKKTFFFNFIPTKADELSETARSIPHQVTRTLVEVRETVNAPTLDLTNPWQIRKLVMATDIVKGKLTLSHSEMFDHVFRYWSLDMANYVVNGNRHFVVIFDYTDDNIPKRYQSENIYVERGPNETYMIGWSDLVRTRIPNPGDEIGLFWDVRSATFSFKLIRRA